MAAEPTESNSKIHPAVWMLLGVAGTIAVCAAVSFRTPLAGQTAPEAVEHPRAEAAPPLPPAPPERGQTLVFPEVAQPAPPAAPAGGTPPKPAAAPKDVPDRTFATPDAVVRAYLAAARWEDRLPCVAEPKAVRQLMATRYRDLDLASAAESGFLPGTLTVKPGTVGGRVIVDVDVHESLPYHRYLRYAVVKSGSGYKVDWLESIKLGEEDAQRAEVNKLGLTTPVLEVEVIKKKQSGSYGCYDLRVTNRSNKLLLYWEVDAAVYDDDGKYLGKAMTNGTNLKAGAEVIGEISFADVRVFDIRSWKPQLGGATIEVSSGVRAEAVKHFALKEVKARVR